MGDVANDGVVDALTAPLGSESEEPAADAVGMIRKAAREERRKRSCSYRHTVPFRHAVDRASGLEFDLRACKYCDAVFSFKGGTTSAALRHLKSTHPQEFFEVQRKRPSLAADAGEEGAQAEEEDGRVSADEALDGKHDGESEESNSHRARRARSKRRRYDDGAASVPQLTVNQLAISHFLANYKDLVAPSRRFALVKHFTYNDREAAMYNVLDDEMRLEFLAHFNSGGDPGPNQGI